jgi:acetyltransferase-like isoleucine patch superfamily enzyme
VTFSPKVVTPDTESHYISINPTVHRFGKIAKEAVIIGNNVSLDMHSIILKGIHIRDNSIIAAGQ